MWHNKIPNLAEKPILTEVQAVNSKMITGTKANVCIQLIKPFKHFNWTVGVMSCKISEIRTYSGSRSSKVIDLGVNRKPMYDFLLVINSNFGRISYHFRDIDA